jgi:hypothetical protein
MKLVSEDSSQKESIFPKYLNLVQCNPKKFNEMQKQRQEGYSNQWGKEALRKNIT